MSVKIIINAFNLANVILDMIIYDHSLSNFIVSSCDLVFILEFLLSLYYFL